MAMPAEPRISVRPAGAGALLLDAATGKFSEETQEKIWALAGELRGMPEVRETVPGMNNLLVIFDPFKLTPTVIEQRLRQMWRTVIPKPVAGRTVEIPIIYGGKKGEDLRKWADHCELSVNEVVDRHCKATYRVAALGAMPGFAYLSGLPSELAMVRRSVPRVSVPKGAVIIGGAQAGVMPTNAPSGWHVIGHTDITLFQIDAEKPALLAPGDTVRFSISGLDHD